MAKKVEVVSTPDEYSIVFYNKDNNVIGKLSFAKQTIKFEGKAEESAQRFFEMYLKGYVDVYIKKKKKK